MTPLISDTFDSDESFSSRETGELSSHSIADRTNEEFHILEEKLSIPQFEGILQRPRLGEMIEKSLSQFGATLISGRSGTGKTALAADFANNRRRVAWYSVESPDVDWRIFSRYFSASLGRTLANKDDMSTESISQFLADIFAKIDAEPKREPLLIVLDDLHHIFDAPWFGEFFNLLLYSLRENTQLLLLCRSRPPNPLWRLRSKQMLNVIDEKLLAFNYEETARFFQGMDLPENAAVKAHALSFGRIAKVKQIASRLQT
jgi:ATP/maltotriose-dependent transcriptional regulator MalT